MYGYGMQPYPGPQLEPQAQFDLQLRQPRLHVTYTYPSKKFGLPRPCVLVDVLVACYLISRIQKKKRKVVCVAFASRRPF
jgi:hypothetical protein